MLTTENSKMLKNGNALFGLLQDCVDAIVPKLLIARVSSFKRSLDFWRRIARKGVVILDNLESGTIKHNAIVFTEISVDVITVICVINHLFSEGGVESASEIGKSLTPGLQEVTPWLEDVALPRKAHVKALGYANGKMVPIKSAPDRRMHGKKPAPWLQEAQHFNESERQPIDVLKACNGKDQIILTEVVIDKIFDVAVAMAVLLTKLMKPLLVYMVTMELIGFAELFVIGRRLNSSPTITAKMVDH